MPPVPWFERDGPPRSGHRIAKAPCAHQEERQRRVRFREIPFQLDRAPHMFDGTCQQRRVRLVLRARHLVLPESSIAQGHMCQRVPRIEDGRAFEIGDCARNKRPVERLEPDPPFRERPVRFEAAGFPECAPRRGANAGAPDRLGELRHEPILQFEHIGQ